MQVGIIPVIERHLRALCGSRTKKLDLFIYSRGGDANVPWALVSLIREYLQDRPFGVLIPFRAHSAATVIALGADEILMTEAGELGPIDATIEKGPHNPREEKSNQPLPISVEDAMGYFNLLDTFDLGEPMHKMDAFKLLTNKVHPLALGSVKRLLDQTKLVASLLLKRRHEPLSDAVNKKIVKQLSTEIYSHEHIIRRGEARELGIDYVNSSEDIEKDLWDLFEQYVTFFNLNEPFSPNDDLIVTGDDEKEFKDLKIACVESTYQNDVCTFDLRVRRVREIPATVNFSIPNLQLSVPPIPAALDAAQVEAFINQVVSRVAQTQIEVAAEKAREALIKAMPSKGFEHVQVHGSWKRGAVGS